MLAPQLQPSSPTLYERALAIREEHYGPEHREVAGVLSKLIRQAVAQGDDVTARTHAQRALAIYEKTEGSEPELYGALEQLGEILLELEQPAAAIPHFERMLTMREADPEDSTQRAGARADLAMALWDAPEGEGRDRERALELAQLARAAFAEREDEDATKQLEELDAWLAERDQ